MDSAMDQQFRLRWNNHPDNMTDVLVSLYHKQQLCDVTLACKGELIRAHQTVLTACSPFFEEMLLNINHPHPIIILADINLGELKAVLEFMYKGEVNVSQNLLSVFLKTAEVLRVKGLTDNNLLNDKERRSGGGGGGGVPAVGEHNRRSHSPAPHEKRKRKSSNCDTNSNSDSRHNDSQATSNYKSTHLPKSQSERDVGSPDDIMPSQLVKQEPQQGSPQHIDSYHSMSEALQTGGSLSVHQDDLLSSHALSDHNEETKPPMPPIDPTDTIDGSKAWHMRLTFDKLPGGCNLHRCKLCGKIVTHIRNHYHVHFPGRFECPLCRATYTRSDNLRTHCKFKHPRYNPDTRKFDGVPITAAAAAAATGGVGVGIGVGAGGVGSNAAAERFIAAAAAAGNSDLSND